MKENELKFIEPLEDVTPAKEVTLPLNLPVIDKVEKLKNNNVSFKEGCEMKKKLFNSVI